jgi:hypothetical protein
MTNEEIIKERMRNKTIGQWNEIMTGRLTGWKKL